VRKEERGAFNLLYAKILRWFNRPNAAFELVAEAVKAADGSPREEAACMLLRGLLFNDILKSVSAIKSFEEALGVLGPEDDDWMRVEILMSLGHAQSNLGRQNEAKENLDRALDLAGKCDASRIIASLYATRALCEFRRGEIDHSVLEAEKGLAHRDKDMIGAADCYRGIAIIQSVSGKMAQAVENYRNALMIFRKSNHAAGMMRNYLSFGLSYLKMSEIDMAEHFFRKAIALAEEGDNMPVLGVAYSRLGTMYLAQGKYVEALSCFDKDRSLSGDIENLSIAAHINRSLGRCFFLTENFEKAGRCYESAIHYFADVEDRVHEYLSKLDLVLSIIFSSAADKSMKRGSSRLADVSLPYKLELLDRNPTVQGQRLFVDACQNGLSENWEKAESLMERALTVMEANNLCIEQAEMLLLFGRLAFARKQPERAVLFLRGALRIAETYSLQGIIRMIISMLDELEEETLVQYTLEKEASKLSEPGYFVESEGASSAEIIVGSSSATRTFGREARSAAATDATILLIGETGTGKELVARSIHRWSRRAARKFVAVNCGAIPKDLVESVLFGHIKGAFTGAVSDQIGSIEAANGGTIFLDEVTELPFMSQVKLLRFLENREIQPLGVAEAKKVDVRVIAATNRDPVQTVKEGVMREDLYFRLSVVPIYIPRLEDRGNDVIELARHFISTIPLAREKGVQSLTRAAESWLKKRPWPGNVRELSNVVLRAIIFAKSDKLTVEDFESKGRPQSEIGLHFEPLDDVIKKHVNEALRICDGNKTRAAKLLGVHRNTLRNKLEKLLK
jgi:DNA-binding NtrC family response regulator